MNQGNVWTHKGTFILAAVGSAVGLGNIWRFPYMIGENGGGAFILVYALTVLFVGIPILMAETLIGRIGRKSPISSITALSKLHKTSPIWKIIGWMGALAALLILSFYSVIAGWSIHFGFVEFSGRLQGVSPEAIALEFTNLLANPYLLMFYHTFFMVASAVVVGRGVHKGLEKGLRILMPLLFIMLLIILAYGVVFGEIEQAADYLFSFKLSELSLQGWLAAMGQAFFSLSLGLGSIMAYGAYMPSRESITRAAITVAFADTGVAIIAGLAIFALVFGASLDTGSGPGLMFVTLPIAFANIPFGNLFGGLFFVLVFIAALSSSISLIEPVTAYLVEKFKLNRMQAVSVVAFAAWLLGIFTVLSFNIWSENTIFHHFFNKTAFDSIDFLTSNILLPLGGVLTALFVGWALTNKEIQNELGTNQVWYTLWQLSVRFVAPLVVLYIFIRGLGLISGDIFPLIIALGFMLSFLIGRRLFRNRIQN